MNFQAKIMMNSLVEKLNKASEAYYNGTEIMSNKEYDDLVDQLQKLEKQLGVVLPNSPTKNVGAPVTGDLPKFKHTHPALSLDKTKDINEFVDKFRKGVEDSHSENDKIVLMYKEDGSTVQAYYKDGKLDKLVTRGNGEVGSIITQNAFIISGLPTELPVKVDMVVRGEAVMSYEEFERINSTLPNDQQYANPRNLASASLTMLDREEVAKRHLMLQAFNLVDITSNIVIDDPEFSSDSIYNELNLRFSSRLALLGKFRFNVVPYEVTSLPKLSESVDNMTDKVKQYSYPVDGLVAAMDNYDYAHRLQGTEHHPHIMNGYAFKWADETKETVLREIEWSPSRTGLLNPVAIFDPVELEGTTVKRASLHNVSEMYKILGPHPFVGERIEVMKSNMIIPMVVKGHWEDE